MCKQTGYKQKINNSLILNIGRKCKLVPWIADSANVLVISHIPVPVTLTISLGLSNWSAFITFDSETTPIRENTNKTHNIDHTKCPMAMIPASL